MDTFTPIAALRDRMHQLEATLTELGEMLSQMPLQEAHVFPLPPVAQGEEHDPIEHIEVGYLSGSDALEATLAAYRDHTMRPGCSTKATMRLPGLLRFPASCAESLRPLVMAINDHKLAFKELVQQAGSRDQKFELVHLALPGTITLQVYRQISMLEGDLFSMGFTWADKQSIKRVTREQVLAMLEVSRGYCPGLSTKEEWNSLIDREVNDVRRVPAGVELRIRRPVKTHPMINLLWSDREPRKQQLKASLPLLVCSDKPINVSPLCNYPPNGRKPRSDRKIGAVPLIERMHLYTYQ